jgi:hypothetical protein
VEYCASLPGALLPQPSDGCFYSLKFVGNHSFGRIRGPSETLQVVSSSAGDLEPVFATILEKAVLLDSVTSSREECQGKFAMPIEGLLKFRR